MSAIAKTIDLGDRTTYIGGSDWSDVLSVPPYGCARRLWYEKRGVDPDYPEEVTPAMNRGTELEDAVVRHYLAAEGATISKGRRPTGPALPSWWKGHADRYITHPGRGRGILEAKTAGERVYWRVKREGPHLGYVAQTHHYLGLTGLPFCDLYMCWPDGWQFSLWTITRDDVLLRSMRDAGDRFMRAVEFGPAPDRLDGKDARCKRCPFRQSCQGLALLEGIDQGDGETIPRVDDPDLVRLLREEREAAEIKVEAEAVLEVCREKVRKAVWHLEAVEVPGFRVYFRPQLTRKLDTKLLEKDNPELVAKYRKEITTRPLRIFAV